MVNGALLMFSDALDFALERRNPRLQLGDRQRIEVLFDQEREGLVGPREILVGIHGLNVDRGEGDVNKPQRGFPTG